MILRSSSVSKAVISCKAVMTVTEFLALLIICSALASTSLQARAHHEGTGLVGRRTNFFTVEQSASHTQNQSDSSVENNNGMELARDRSIPKRLRRMESTQADRKLTNKDRITEKKPIQTRTGAANGNVLRKPEAVKGAAHSSLASKSKRLRPSSGIQTTLSSLHERKVVPKEKMEGLAFQELEITTKRTLKSTASSPSQGQGKEEISSETNTYKPAPPSATSGHRGQTSPIPQSQTFHVSGSMTYESSEASDLSDIIGMDYGRARRKPPIHNKVPEP